MLPQQHCYMHPVFNNLLQLIIFLPREAIVSYLLQQLYEWASKCSLAITNLITLEINFFSFMYKTFRKQNQFILLS